MIRTLLLVALAALIAASSAPAREIEDAEALALEQSGELLAPPELVDRIRDDLDAILVLDPSLDKIHVTLDFVPGYISVKLDEEAIKEYRDGTYTGFEDLDSFYGPILREHAHQSIPWVGREFEANYHPDRLAEIYAGAPGVVLTEKAYGDVGATDIRIEPPGILHGEPVEYVFRYGWGDCPAGCIYNHFWRFSISPDDEVSLLGEWGDDLVPMQPVTWGRLKSRYATP